MKLKEAIKHAREKALKLGYCKCGTEHMQLAGWLKELKEARKKIKLYKEMLEANEIEAKEIIADCNKKVAELKKQLSESESKAREARVGNLRIAFSALNAKAEKENARVRENMRPTMQGIARELACEIVQEIQSEKERKCK